MIGDLLPAAAEKVAHELAAAGHRAIGLALDGADEGHIHAAVATAVDRYGGLDGIHVNFASFKDGESGEDILGLPMHVFDEVMRVNARGFVLCTRIALPALIARGGGSIVYTGSGAAYAGEPVRAAYAMSKAAVHALMRHVAVAFGPQGIRCNTISAGVVSHERFEAVMPADMVEAFKARTALKSRLGKPEDIAALGALLMSDDGAYITGQVITVDGGIQMRA